MKNNMNYDETTITINFLEYVMSIKSKPSINIASQLSYLHF